MKIFEISLHKYAIILTINGENWFEEIYVRVSRKNGIILIKNY